MMKALAIDIFNYWFQSSAVPKLTSFARDIFGKEIYKNWIKVLRICVNDDFCRVLKWCDFICAGCGGWLSVFWTEKG